MACHVCAHMYPAECDKVVLVLYQKQLLLVLSVAVIRTTALLWDDYVCHREGVPCLKGVRGTLRFWKWIIHYTVKQKQNLSHTSFPQRIPQVSTARIVLLFASCRNLEQSSAGTATCRKPSNGVAAAEHTHTHLQTNTQAVQDSEILCVFSTLLDLIIQFHNLSFTDSIKLTNWRAKKETWE